MAEEGQFGHFKLAGCVQQSCFRTKNRINQKEARNLKAKPAASIWRREENNEKKMEA